MKLEIPIIVGFDNMESLLDDLKKLQTYKLFEDDEMVLVDIEDVADVLVKHIKAKEKQPDAYENALKLAKYGLNSPPSVQPDNRLSKITDLMEGTIDHFDLDDAMDLLYQIKEVLKNG